jgi:hypothetical protein
MYSVNLKKGCAKPPALRGCSAYASESETILQNSVVQYSAVRLFQNG